MAEIIKPHLPRCAGAFMLNGIGNISRVTGDRTPIWEWDLIFTRPADHPVLYLYWAKVEWVETQEGYAVRLWATVPEIIGRVSRDDPENPSEKERWLAQEIQSINNRSLVGPVNRIRLYRRGGALHASAHLQIAMDVVLARRLEANEPRRVLEFLTTFDRGIEQLIQDHEELMLLKLRPKKYLAVV